MELMIPSGASDIPFTRVRFDNLASNGSQTQFYSVVVDNVVYSASPVPIHAAVWLLCSGLIGLIGIRRFKK
jgi:hypothetical protein